MYFRIYNHNTNAVEYFDTESEARARIAQIAPDFIFKNQHRFSVAFEEVVGSNTTWKSVDVSKASEDAVLHVFNHVTGRHEKVVGKTRAIEKVAQLQQDFVSSAPEMQVTEVPFRHDQLPEVKGAIDL